MALDIPKMWARRMEAEMKDWEDPVALLEHPLGGSALMAPPEEMARRVRECRKEMRRVMERHLGREA